MIVPFDDLEEEATAFLSPFMPPIRYFMVMRTDILGKKIAIPAIGHAIEYSTGCLAFIQFKLERREGKPTLVQYTCAVFKEWDDVQEVPMAAKGVH